MKERPILFSGTMVQAILEGRKTQTRRVVKPTMTPPRVAPLHMEPWIIDGEQETDDHGLPCWVGTHPDYPTGEKWFSCPYGQHGDRLWVRETWNMIESVVGGSTRPVYRASPETFDRYPGISWRPSIFMPRALSRITLEITGVRVERVQDISEADSVAEGVQVQPGRLSRPIGSKEPPTPPTHRNVFSALWDSINEARGYGWETNCWVWVIEFKRLT